MNRRTVVASACVVLALALAGCGGGGGGGGTESVNYDGASNAAMVDTTNAVALARDMTLDAISGDTVVDTSILPLAAGGPSLGEFRDPDFVLGLLTEALDMKVGGAQVDLLSTAADRLVVLPYECIDVTDRPGDWGGTVSGRICGNYDAINEEFVSVDFFSAVFNDFSNDDNGSEVIQGGIIMDLTDSPNSMIFRDFSIVDIDSGDDLYLDGILTLAQAGAVTTVKINLYIRDYQYDLGFWYNNVTIVKTDFGSYVTIAVDGRIYDFYDGYVDLDTTEPFEVTAGADYPYNGTIEFTADGGLVVRLEAGETGFMVFVDLTGDGTDDWQTSSPVPWEEPT